MKYVIEFNDDARIEMIDAYLWYEERKKGLGERLIDSINGSLQTISIHPHFFAKRKGNYRETKVRVFPYVIVYEIFEDARVVHVASIYHGKRNPDKKYRKRK